jgi:hypothetical protein
MVRVGGGEEGENLVRERAVVRPAIPPPRMRIWRGCVDIFARCVWVVSTGRNEGRKEYSILDDVR